MGVAFFIKWITVKKWIKTLAPFLPFKKSIIKALKRYSK